MPKNNRSERGQAIVLIILAIVGIFGFAALAVDMGAVYAERRRAQNAADAAVLAAAFAQSTNPNPSDATAKARYKQAAVDVAIANGYNADQIKVYSPPITGTYDTVKCGCEYFQVIINSRVDPIFSQVIGLGIKQISTEAVARGTQVMTTSFGRAIHALSKDDDALIFDGTTGVNVIGGDIYSNGGGRKNGGSGVIAVTQGEVKIGAGWDCNGCRAGTVSSPVQTGTGYMSVAPVPRPYCPASDTSIGGVNYYVHNGISGSMTLQPGIHCVHGDIQLNGQDVLKGDKVLIVLLDGGMKITGQARIDLKRANSLKDNYGYQWGGLLIYAPKTNTNDIELGGTSDSWFSGTVYAPGSMCDLGGTSQTKALHTSIICDKVRTHGTADVKVVYKQNENYQLPPMVELVK